MSASLTLTKTPTALAVLSGQISNAMDFPRYGGRGGDRCDLPRRESGI